MPTPRKKAPGKTGIPSATGADKPESVAVTVRLPKALHAKLAEIAAAEGKSVPEKVGQAAREHAAQYARTARTVQAYVRTKPAS